jgi:hypothetical protein
MNVPGGGISKGSSSTWKRYAHSGRVIAGSSYTFEYPYEMMPGVWEFEIAVLGKTVVR